jgi:acyl-CoA thioesterase
MTGNKNTVSQNLLGPHNVQLENWISCAPFEKLLNMKIIQAQDAHATLTMPFHFDYAQGAGLMHGGSIVSLADTAVVMAIKSILPPMTHFATIKMDSKFLAPVKKGIITAKATAKRQGERTIFGSATVFDESKKPVLEFSSTFKIARHPEIKSIQAK